MISCFNENFLQSEGIITDHSHGSLMTLREICPHLRAVGFVLNFLIIIKTKEYKERIYREFLEIEPPENFDQNLLK